MKGFILSLLALLMFSFASPPGAYATSLSPHLSVQAKAKQVAPTLCESVADVAKKVAQATPATVLATGRYVSALSMPSASTTGAATYRYLNGTKLRARPGWPSQFAASYTDNKSLAVS